MASQAIRPRTQPYTLEEKAKIIEHVIEQLEASRALARILNDDANMCSVPLFMQWCRLDPVLSNRVESAREVGAGKLIEEIPNIADEVAEDKNAIAKAKLRIYARESYAAKIAPKKYGAKLDLTSDGEKLEPSNTLNDNRIQSIMATIAKRKRDGVLPPPEEENPDGQVDPFS